ncbi:class I SAM-dependent methyltransferase [Kamptonema formosum]|uniref:class I SAM-dependent methyltransferase n=1 Tax=Kamptonema formosum TaxID=331992 RepID=UPI00034B8317|nr:class I SAM-dependent methyltransferase [Oscillatoria sp. PCC 10802]
MDKQDFELSEKIRQQFDTAPYPRQGLDESPKDDYNFLYIHNLVTPYYLRNKKIIETEGKVILDAGCGSGYKALALAEANPGAKIVGIDLSEQSVKFARQRLEYHGFENAEFYAMPIEYLPSLGIEFDYINCDEVLYLMPDLVAGLRALKSALKPEGIIRGNLHSLYQRESLFRAQELFKMMGLMDENPRELEMEIVRETMKALKDDSKLKAQTWKPSYETDDQTILSNFLLVGDRGYTVPQLFSVLRAADLEFVSMVNWRQWEVTDLFKEPDDLPAFLAMSWPEIALEDRLHMYELLHPIHRLLDFWCGQQNQAQPFVPVEEWTDSDWLGARVQLHPQLRNAKQREDLLNCVANQRPYEISKYVQTPALAPVMLGNSIAACLLPLWEGAQPVPALVERWLKVRSVDAVTLEPVSEQTAFEEVKGLLSDLEAFLYVLLERSA